MAQIHRTLDDPTSSFPSNIATSRQDEQSNGLHMIDSASPKSEKAGNARGDDSVMIRSFGAQGLAYR